MAKDLVTTARHDPAHVLAPGLFKSFKRGDRKEKNLDIKYKYGDVTLRFAGAWQLGTEDLRVLQGVAAMATQTKSVIDFEDPQSANAKQLVLLLEPRNQESQNAAAIKTSLQRLMREVGYKTDGGKNRTQVIDSLRRLSNVTTYVGTGNKEQSSHLLSYFVDKDSGQLVIGVNPRLTKAIIGDQYTLIDMREVRALKSGPARLLQQRLSAVVDPGKTRLIGFDTLVSYVWPDPVPAKNASTMRQRRKTLRSVIKELEATHGWHFIPKGEDAFTVCRQKAGYKVDAGTVSSFEAQAA